MTLSQQELEESCIYFIENKNLEKVKQFLSSGFNIHSMLHSRYNIWDSNCFSVLAIAAFSGSKNVVEFLLQRNVNVNQVDILKNRTALHWAVASGDYEISKILIESGAIINALDRNSVSPLIIAANLGDLKIVQLLIKNGANLNQADRMNITALHYACMRLNSIIAKELILNGCVSNTRTAFSLCSPLKYLLQDKQYKVAGLLIESGWDLRPEKWIMDDLFIRKYQIDPEFIKWVRSTLKNPPSLMSICRRKIRMRLGDKNLYKNISSLNIPKHLINYLKMKF